MFGQPEGKVEIELGQAIKMLKSLEDFWNDALTGDLDLRKITAARAAVQMTTDHLENLVQLSKKLHGLVQKSEKIQLIINENL